MKTDSLAVKEETLAEYRIFTVRKLPTINVEKDLEWMCRSLSFMEPRDKERTAYNIFRVIVETARANKGLSSDELAEKLALSRGTMVHHLNKMIKSGLVIRHESQYKLRGRSLKSTIEEVQRDVNRIFNDLQSVAETIDDTLGLLSRPNRGGES
ncbi:MAG: MarR family transcriptional regulator [Candidatus Bathyarchaeota archaeon]|nr:MarR family transcriptional regulator [Candidatus Bathyarchaeota archaeon]